MLPKGLELFMADIIDEDTGEQTIWYITGKTYNSAFKRFIKEANRIWSRYSYYFDAVKDVETIDIFAEKHECIKADIYE